MLLGFVPHFTFRQLGTREQIAALCVYIGRRSGDNFFCRVVKIEVHEQNPLTERMGNNVSRAGTTACINYWCRS